MKVALLFTDIEGSTRLLDTADNAYKRALQQHHEIIRRHTQAHDGEEYLDVGDGFCLAFRNAADAAAAASAAQQALSVAEWPTETGPLRVRMAIHCGDAEFRDGQYRGAPVHLVARLLAAGHGGQILGSAAARAGSEDSGFPWRRLGAFRLRGFGESEEIFQLNGGETFPPLNADYARRHNLPITQDTFVGRRDELAKLERLLQPEMSNAWLVTLTGSGGMGKTRLAIETGLRLLNAYDHGVHFVPLASVSEGTLVFGEILKALGVSTTTDSDPLRQISQSIGNAPTLLILDNFEQLQAEGAGILSRLRAVVPQVRLLVTSRARVGIDGEREVALRAFPVPAQAEGFNNLARYDCVQLLVERARRAGDHFTLTAENAAAVAGICRLLDGLPLAIELAATRLQVLTTHELFDTLQTEFSGSDRKGIPGVSDTLQATFEWSRSLLPQEIAGFLTTFSVFRGGATAIAVANVHDITPRLALAYLHYLLTCSLVRASDRNGSMRFDMLEPIRQMAEASGGEQIARAVEKHSEYFRQLARKVAACARTPQEADLPREVEPELSNLLAAIDRAPSNQHRIAAAVNLHHYAINHSSNRSLRALLPERPDGGPVKPILRAHGWHAAGALDLQVRALDEAEKAFRRALELYEEAGAEDEMISEQFNLAIVAARRGNREEAYAIYSGILEAFRKRDAPLKCAYVLAHMGNQAREQGWLDKACEHLEESMRLCEQAGDLGMLADVRSTLGETLLAHGNLAGAATLLREGLALKVRLGQTNTHSVLAPLAEIALREGNLAHAAFYAAAARAVIARHRIECAAETEATLKSAESASEAGLEAHTLTRWREKGATASPNEWLSFTEHENGEFSKASGLSLLSTNQNP